MRTIDTYIIDADRTSAPVEPVMDRLARNPQALTSLFYILHGAMAYAAALDKWKAWAYYGKEQKEDCGAGGCPLPPTSRNLAGKAMSTEGLENALSTVDDLHFLEIMHAIIGIASEAGEMVESLLPVLYEGKPLDAINIREESGDLTWYLAKLFKYTNSDFEGVMAMNIAKLRQRYPEKFTEAAAKERDIAGERAVLESPVDHRTASDIEEDEAAGDKFAS